MSEAKDVFEILMREHADMLLAFLRASVRDPHTVEDIFQVETRGEISLKGIREPMEVFSLSENPTT